MSIVPLWSSTSLDGRLDEGMSACLSRRSRDEGVQQRMQPTVGARIHLRLKERRDVERMIAKLERFEAAIAVRALHQPGGAELRQVCGVEAVAAPVVALERLSADDRRQQRARHDSDRRASSHDGAGKGCNDELAPVGIHLRVRRPGKAGGVAGELEQRVLKPAAGCEQRDLPFPRRAKRAQHGGIVAVRRARNDPQALDSVERCRAFGIGACPSGFRA